MVKLSEAQYGTKIFFCFMYLLLSSTTHWGFSGQFLLVYYLIRELGAFHTNNSSMYV